MSQYFVIHPDNPQSRLIHQAVEIIREGGVIVYPTDSCYALGCQIGNKVAMERVRSIRQIDEKHHLTLFCRDLSSIAQYAQVDNRQYRLLKMATPGSYTFILQATRQVPKRLQHPKKNTIGIRIPDNKIALMLLAELNEPILSSTLILPGDEFARNEIAEIRDMLGNRVDLIIDGGSCGIEPTTVVDLTEDPPLLLRMGKGGLSPFGIS